jgi:hypothetical protein
VSGHLGALLVAAMSVGSLHSLAPDHWVPFAAVARARGWGAGRTARLTVLCGLGHVSVSVLLGLLALAAGSRLFEALGERLEAMAGLLLVAFGVAYALWGLRRAAGRRWHGHAHHHYDHVHEPGTTTAWTLFLLYCADPCVAVVPVMAAAWPAGSGSLLGVVAAYEVATIAAMVLLVSSARQSATWLRARWAERYGDVAAGLVIVVVGVATTLLGW